MLSENGDRGQGGATLSDLWSRSRKFLFAATLVDLGLRDPYAARAALNHFFLDLRGRVRWKLSVAFVVRKHPSGG